MIALRDGDADAMIVRYRAGAPTDAYVNRHVEAGQGVGGQVLLTGRPFRTDNYAEDPRLTKNYLQWQPDEASVASVAVPIRIGDRIDGLLYAQNRSVRPFDGRDEAILMRLADHAAIAIKNAQLFAREQAVRAQAEATSRALAESEERSRHVVETALDAVITTDGRGRVTGWNAQAEAIFGWTRAEALGRSLTQTIIPERYRAEHEDGLRGLPETGAILGQRVELSALRRDGREFPIELSISATRTGDAVAFSAFIRDISERRRAEERLRESEERYRGLFDHLPVGLYRVTPGGQILAANPALAQILGYPDAGTLMAASAIEFWVDPEARRTALAGEIEPAVLRDFEARWRRADGQIIWVRNSVRAIRDSDGRVLYHEGAAEDITERKHLEEQLQQAQKMEAIGRLAGGIAHDFNNLLTVITGRAEILRGRLGAGADGPAVRDLRLIQETARRAAALTSQLLAFSRKQVLQPTILDLNDVVHGMSPMLRRLIGENVELVVTAGGRLGRVRADAGRLEQVVMNLAINARDAMPQGGRLIIETANVDLDETFTARQPGSRPGPHVLLSVSDTGVGMDETTRSRVFEPFFTTKEPGKGTGLGLSMVYGIVKQHDGYVSVSSELGQGAMFRIYLPQAEGPLEARAAAPPPPELAHGAETILLVEDEDEVRELTREVLELKGYYVLVARHPGEALLLCERHPRPIHLLLTDLMMPQMNGQELSERLVRLRPDLKILFMSAYSDAMLDRRGTARRVPLLEKPFLPDELARKVRETLDAPAQP
jgi:two-component system, cell cycle sensor histidine kinase and response regulator CckA